MKKELCLEIQNKKTRIIDVNNGIEFLGAFIKPYRTYISNKTVKRMKKKLYYFNNNDTDVNVSNMVNSYLGIFSHYKSNSIKNEVLYKTTKILDYGYFTENNLKFIDYKKQ